MSIETVFENLIQTIERNAVNNSATIANVELWAKSWREEAANCQDEISTLHSLTQHRLYTSTGEGGVKMWKMINRLVPEGEQPFVVELCPADEPPAEAVKKAFDFLEKQYTSIYGPIKQ